MVKIIKFILYTLSCVLGVSAGIILWVQYDWLIATAIGAIISLFGCLIILIAARRRRTS